MEILSELLAPWEGNPQVTGRYRWTGISITRWHHDMETLSTLLAFCDWNHWSPIHCLLKGLVIQSFVVSLSSAWASCWRNSRVASDLRHVTHVMMSLTNLGGHSECTFKNMIYTYTAIGSNPLNLIPSFDKHFSILGNISRTQTYLHANTSIC